MNEWVGLENKSNVFVVEGRKSSGEGLVLDHLRDGGVVVNGRKAGIENGVARAELDGRFLRLGRANGHVLERAHRTLVHGERGPQLIEAQAHERKPAAKGDQRLAE